MAQLAGSTPPKLRDLNEKIAELLRNNQPARARNLVESSLKRAPGNARLLLSLGEIVGHTEGPQGAACYYGKLLDDPKIGVWAAERLRKILETHRPGIEERLEIGRLAAESTIDAQKKALLLNGLLASAPDTDQVPLLREIVPRAGLFAFEWQLATRETTAGNIEAALQVLENARAQGRSSGPATLLLCELLAVCNRLPEAIAILESTIEQQPDYVEAHRRLIALLQRNNEFAKSADALEAAMRKWPRDWMLLFRFNRMPMPLWQFTDLVSLATGNTQGPAPLDDRHRLQLAIACLHDGQYEKAIELLDHDFSAPTDSMALPLLKAVKARTPAEWRMHARLKDDRTRDVQFTVARQARATVVIPTGITFGYLPLPMVDGLLAQHRLNVIYLRDFNKRSYLRGVASLGRDEAQTVANLKRMLKELGPSRVLAIGSSQGGFAALRLGALLDASVAVSFAGPTHLGLVYDKAKPSIWNPGFFLQQILDREKDLPLDLEPLLAKARPTRFLQYYGERAADDARQAKRIAGLPSVSLIPVGGVDDHHVVDHMIADGSFDRLLDELCLTA